MAAPSTWGSVQGNYGKIGISTSVSTSAASVSVTVEVWFWSKWSVSDTGNTLYFDNLAVSGSATTSKGAVSISTTVDTGTWSTSNQVKLASYTYTYNRSTTESTRYLYARLKGVDIVGSEMSASATFTVPALQTYTITYNANGGKNAPSTQTKYYGKAITLSTSKPTRDGYTFLGWNTSSTATSANSSYDPGDTYSSNANLTLYAVWKANTYTVTYNANGGTGAPASQTKTYGVALTLSSTKPSRTNYTFKGWGTSASATTVAYAAGGSYTTNAAVTLYAIWELAYVKPKISGLTVTRCDSAGAASNAGTYAKVVCSWSTYYTVTSVKIEWKADNATSWSSTAVSASNTSGNVSSVIGAGALSTETTYSIRVTVTDRGGSTTVAKTLNSMILPIDFLAGGKGAAIGMVASEENYLDIGFYTRFRANAVLCNNRILYAQRSNYAIRNAIIMTTSNAFSLGYGGYQYKDGNTDIYGNAINIISNGYINFTGKPVIANRVLWSGAWWMDAGKTITLSEAVSKQANGIVLVFSGYENNAAKDASWNTFYVSKQEVSAIAGGRTFIMGINAGFSKVGAKYLYLADTTITGHESNASTGTNSGITFNNAYFVLRYVIGV